MSSQSCRIFSSPSISRIPGVDGSPVATRSVAGTFGDAQKSCTRRQARPNAEPTQKFRFGFTVKRKPAASATMA